MTRPSRQAVVAALAAAVLSIALGAVPQASSARARAQNFVGKPLGVMWDKHAAPRSVRHATHGRRLAAGCPSPETQPDPACNMTYHNGALVIGPHQTYVVYWEPSGSTVSTNYHSLIERYFTDVAAASGRPTNVYAVDTQYTDSTNAAIAYQQTWKGSFTDTNAFPARNSSCPISDGTTSATTCLTETQEATELDNFIQTNSLPRGLGVIYFLVLPQSVETCYDDFSECGNWLTLKDGSGNAKPRYCAYHSSFNISSHGLTLWANQPYVNVAAGHCDSGNRSSPNGDVDADSVINEISHEHNETITDPTSGGWFDFDGTGEIGDKCNFVYGTALASNTNGAYNQLINGHPYEIQQEWSNATTSCVSNYGAVAPTAAFTSSPASPHALDTVSFDASTSASNDTGGTLISYDWTFGDGATGTGVAPTHAYATAGTYTATLTVKSDAGLTSAVSHDVVVVQRPTVVTYTGDVSGHYHDSVTLRATLVDQATSNGIGNESIDFTLGSQGCSAKTDSSGAASCSLTLMQVPGSYTAQAAFAGDSVYAGNSGSSPFTLGREETTLSYTGPKVILAGTGSTVTVTARLDEDGTADADGDGGAAVPSPAGQSIAFALGTQGCSGIVSAVTGTATCTIAGVSAATLGSKTLSASFTGDTYYGGAADSASVIVFAFPSRGAFTLGDLTTAPTVSWWSDSWWALNTLTGGTAPLSFKGFDGSVTALPATSPATTCGATFTTAPGNSPPPTGDVPSYMGVLVASSVTKSGSTINGTWAKIVVVRTAPGYSPSPGHPGTGTVVATFCG